MDTLKARGYRWNNGEDDKPRAWWIEVPKDDLNAEKEWLFAEIFSHPVDLPTETITAKSRYSLRV